MIIVNDPGLPETYPQLRHSAWIGLTATDLIFPAFLFIVGTSLVFSFKRRFASGASGNDLIWIALRRSAIIFMLGLVYNGFPLVPWTRLRFMNVLQRIAICYLAAALLYVRGSTKTRWATIGALLIGYWALLHFVPVPGFGSGQLSPEGNLASFVDRWALAGHLYRPEFDPEGLMSTLPAIATTLFGVLAGALLCSERSQKEKVLRLAAGGAAALGAGLLWSPFFPIIKPIWTSSFCLVTAGVAALGLAACYWIVEVRGSRGWTAPFKALGANAIAAYFLSEGFYELQKRLLVARPEGGTEQLRIRLCEILFGAWLVPKAASLAYALGLCLLWLCVFSFFSRRDVVVNV